MDYALTRARVFPRFELDRTVTPTPVNALGAPVVGALDEHGAQRLVAAPGAPGSESVASDAVRVISVLRRHQRTGPQHPFAE